MDIRALREIQEFDDANRLEAEIWGALSPTPRHLLAVFAHHGGLVLGAYQDDRLVGLSVGFPGLDPKGQLYLHSHLLAVHPVNRRRGVGAALKRAQWYEASARGFGYIGWTYDPLAEPNARFNLAVLGARVADVRENVYGQLNDALNGDLPTHRFWVVWNPDNPQRTVKPGDVRELAIVPDVAAIRRHNPEKARRIVDAWFATARQWWDGGWRVVGVRADDQGLCYQWAKGDESEGETRANRGH